MSIHDPWTNSPDGDPMSSAVTFARSLEKRERRRGLSVPEARRSVARKLRIGVGTLENLVRDRVKRVDARIRDRLQALMVNEIEQEILRLTHELEMVRRCGSHPASLKVGEIETHLACAKALLSGAPQ